MNKASTNIIELLNDDIVSHGLLAQSVAAMDSQSTPQPLALSDVLEELLSSGEVEIGDAKLTAEYVEFIAWKGTVKERVLRAINAVDRVNEPDKEFAYWLCLRQNIDRFEDV